MKDVKNVKKVKKAIITRADDFGSSHSANAAIYEAAKKGFVRNVSVMACGPYLEEAADLLAKEKDICFGLHACINAEWDYPFWGPIAPREKVPSLIDQRGAFYQSQTDFLVHKISLKEVVTEYQYQLDKVRKLGFPISYMDSHMFPEVYVPGLMDAISSMAEEEGLIDHKWFNIILPGNDVFSKEEGSFEKALIHMEGQYLMVMHPAKYGEEMCKMGNKNITGEMLAQEREKDYMFMTDNKNIELCEKYQVQLLRYDEAVRHSCQMLERYGFYNEIL